jgi:hypothetical protein
LLKLDDETFNSICEGGQSRFYYVDDTVYAQTLIQILFEIFNKNVRNSYEILFRIYRVLKSMFVSGYFQLTTLQ